MKGGFVYVISNSHNTVLYTGVTNNLLRRIQEHKTSLNPDSFASKYHVHRLLYYEYFERIQDAIYREKQIKKWKREWKFNVIKESNPTLKDLFDELF